MESRKGNAFDEMQSHREQSASFEVSFRVGHAGMAFDCSMQARTVLQANFRTQPSPEFTRFVDGLFKSLVILLRGYIIL